MSVLQIILLVLGCLLFVVSFFVSDRNKEDNKSTYLEDREFQNRAQQALDEAGDKLSQMVDETVQYAMQKSERGLERVSNEKIMAVSEYAEAVLSDMEKSHKEILFLYDMLNEKTTALKNSIREADELRKNIDKANSQLINDKISFEEENKDFNVDATEKLIVEETENIVSAQAGINTSIPDIYGGNSNGNKNDKILAMHDEGKSNVAIAKELGLGVGEVKLVIDLFKGAK